MHYKVWGFIVLLCATAGLFFFLVYRSVHNTHPIPPNALQGKRIFQQKACIECHTVFGNGGYVGGDLTKIHSRSGHEALKEYLSHPPLITGASKKRHVQLSGQEAEAVVDYLKYLDTINTLDWPPNADKRRNSVKDGS